MKKIDRKITINGVEILIRANNEQEYAEILAMTATAKACLLEPIPQKHDFAEYTRNWFEVFSKPNIERATRQTRFSGKIKKSSMKKSRTGLSVRPFCAV